jgi:hypothetical protein
VLRYKEEAMTRIALVLIGLVLSGTTLIGCGSAEKPPPVVVITVEKYTPEAIAGIKKLFGITDNTEAIGVLDGAVSSAITTTAIGGTKLVDTTAIRLSGLVSGMSDRILAQVTNVPDEDATVRAFVVGSTCDALDAAQNGKLTNDQIRAIVKKHLDSAGLPAVVGDFDLVTSVAGDIQDAVEENDLATAFPKVGRSIICWKAG